MNEWDVTTLLDRAVWAHNTDRQQYADAFRNALLLVAENHREDFQITLPYSSETEELEGRWINDD